MLAMLGGALGAVGGWGFAALIAVGVAAAGARDDVVGRASRWRWARASACCSACIRRRARRGSIPVAALRAE